VAPLAVTDKREFFTAVGVALDSEKLLGAVPDPRGLPRRVRAVPRPHPDADVEHVPARSAGPRGRPRGGDEPGGAGRAQLPRGRQADPRSVDDAGPAGRRELRRRAGAVRRAGSAPGGLPAAVGRDAGGRPQHRRGGHRPPTRASRRRWPATTRTRCGRSPGRRRGRAGDPRLGRLQADRRRDPLAGAAGGRAGARGSTTG
jgi:hypothetical protein